MKFTRPHRSLIGFSGVVFIAALLHLMERVYVPVRIDERVLPAFTVALQHQVAPNQQLNDILAKFAAPQAAPQEQQKVDFDGRKLGTYYVSLLGIYRVDGVLKAILSLQPDSAGEKQLLRIGQSETFSGFVLTQISAQNITIRLEQQTVTLKLFRNSQQNNVIQH